MLYQINTPERSYTFEASSFTTACVVTTLLGGGFYSLWQNEKQIMPVFMFGGVEEWFRRVFGKRFADLVPSVPADEIAQIYRTILGEKPQQLPTIHSLRATMLHAASQWRPNYKPTPWGSWMIPGREVVQLLDGREMLVREVLGEVGINFWLVDVGEIPAYPITPGENGRWVEVETDGA